MTQTTTSPEQADINERWAPSQQQRDIAAAILASDPTIDVVVIGVALPGKARSFWTLGQLVEPAPGFWPARNTFSQQEPLNFSLARDLADAAAQRQLAGRNGQTSYISIERDGTWGTFPGIYGTTN